MAPGASEVVWHLPRKPGVDPLFGNSPEQASGGGVSLIYPIPAWQQGISMTDNQGSTTMRNLPDVALVADNIDVVWGNDLIGLSFDFTEVDCFSLSTPLWAGFMALVNQQSAANGQPPSGFINPRPLRHRQKRQLSFLLSRHHQRGQLQYQQSGPANTCHRRL